MDVSQLEKNSQEMFKIIQEHQKTQNDTAQKLIKMALGEKTGAGKTMYSGRLVDFKA
jgi:hypothetical protein